MRPRRRRLFQLIKRIGLRARYAPSQVVAILIAGGVRAQQPRCEAVFGHFHRRRPLHRGGAVGQSTHRTDQRTRGRRRAKRVRIVGLDTQLLPHAGVGDGKSPRLRRLGRLPGYAARIRSTLIVGRPIDRLLNAILVR